MTARDWLHVATSPPPALTTPAAPHDALGLLYGGCAFAHGLEHNARTDTEWREAMRVWLVTVMEWMRAASLPAEFQSLPAKLNGYLHDLDESRQPERLRPLPREPGGGAPGDGYADVTRPAAATAIVDFLARQQAAEGKMYRRAVTAIETDVAIRIGWRADRLRRWRKRFRRQRGRNEANPAAERIYEETKLLLEKNASAFGTGASVADVIRTANIFGA
jgi:hypothetical protein